MSFRFDAPQERAVKLAKRAQAKRLLLNISQQTLSDRSGVSFGVIKKFERTGKISLESLLKISLVLGVMDEFDQLFAHDPLESFDSLDKILKSTSRKRGRQ